MSDCPKNHHFKNFSQDCALEDIPIQGMLITYGTFTYTGTAFVNMFLLI